MPRKKSEKEVNNVETPETETISTPGILTPGIRLEAEKFFTERFAPVMEMLNANKENPLVQRIIDQMYVDVVDFAEQKKRQSEIFKVLSSIDVSDMVTERENDQGKVLRYLSWAKAYKVVMERYPFMTWKALTFYDKEGSEHRYQYDRVTGNFTVYTEVNIEGMVKREALTVTNEDFMPIRYDGYRITSRGVERFVPRINDNLVNNSIRRCLVKTFALFGLGIDVYCGEDIPEERRNNEKITVIVETDDPEPVEPRFDQQAPAQDVKQTTPEQVTATPAEKPATDENHAPEQKPEPTTTVPEKPVVNMTQSTDPVTADPKPEPKTVQNTKAVSAPTTTEHVKPAEPAGITTLDEAMAHKLENGGDRVKGLTIGDFVLKTNNAAKSLRMLNVFAEKGVGKDKVAASIIVKALNDGTLAFPESATAQE